MRPTKLGKSLLALLLVLMALSVTMSGFTTAATANSVDAHKVEKKVFTAVDTFVSELPQNGYGLIGATDLNTLLGTADEPFVVDVRGEGTWAAGHIPGAVNIPLVTLVDNLDKLPGKDQPIVVYCGIGHSGAIAMTSLSMLGYTNVKSLAGGFSAWSAAGLPVTT
jgi:rhodanese-related sulfurtransferase